MDDPDYTDNSKSYSDDEYPYYPFNIDDVLNIPPPQEEKEEEKKQLETIQLSVINTPVVNIIKQHSMEVENDSDNGGGDDDRGDDNGSDSESDDSGTAGDGDGDGDDSDDDDNQHLDLIRRNDYHGKDIKDKNLKRAIEMYKKYENLAVICKLCKKHIFNLEFFGYNRDNYICIECAAKEYSNLGELKDRYPENGKVRCKRLAHCKPEWQFVKHSLRSGYTTGNLCIHCRNCKRFEYLVKISKSNSNSKSKSISLHH